MTKPRDGGRLVLIGGLFSGCSMLQRMLVQNSCHFPQKKCDIFTKSNSFGPTQVLDQVGRGHGQKTFVSPVAGDAQRCPETSKRCGCKYVTNKQLDYYYIIR